MVLSDTTLRKMITDKSIEVSPFDDSAVQPASIDLRLSDHFVQLDEDKTEWLTLNKCANYKEFRQPSIMLQPHSFILASTIEYIKLPCDLTAFIEGRSSIGRTGLFIQNAGWVDAGFEGTITLELFNANRVPILLEAGRRICQMVVVKMDSPASEIYKGKYKGQRLTTASRIFEDIECSKNT
ncbi:MAG: dCTP deaminase [Fibrobacteres bacterium]|nr:dCTP deaminase [Fibrobacterota bacterium]